MLLSRGYYHESVVTIFGVLVAQKRERRGKGGVGRAPLQKSIRGGVGIFSHFTPKNSRTFIYWDSEELPKNFFRYFIGLIIRKFILRSNIDSHKKWRSFFIFFFFLFGLRSCCRWRIPTFVGSKAVRYCRCIYLWIHCIYIEKCVYTSCWRIHM